MPYATRLDLIDCFGEAEITQRESMLPDGAVDKALADATADIDAYLAPRYAVPVVAHSPTLVRLTCDIARYYLAGDSASEDTRRRYADAIAALRDIAAGRRMLDVPIKPEGAPSQTALVTPGAPLVFKRPRP